MLDTEACRRLLALFYTPKHASAVISGGVLACPNPRSCAKTNLIDCASARIQAQAASAGLPCLRKFVEELHHPMLSKGLLFEQSVRNQLHFIPMEVEHFFRKLEEFAHST